MNLSPSIWLCGPPKCHCPPTLFNTLGNINNIHSQSTSFLLADTLQRLSQSLEKLHFRLLIGHCYHSFREFQIQDLSDSVYLYNSEIKPVFTYYNIALPDCFSLDMKNWYLVRELSSKAPMAAAAVISFLEDSLGEWCRKIQSVKEAIKSEAKEDFVFIFSMNSM